jgi:hypothetical protein
MDGAGNDLSGRDRTRLAKARANGYLNATCRSRLAVTRAYHFWCWRLRVPLIAFERNTPRSAYGRVHLDLSTTGHGLTELGQIEMTDLIRRLRIPGRAAVSSGDGEWENIPQKRLEELARTILRVATRLGNYELRGRSATARAGNVLAWRASA